MPSYVRQDAWCCVIPFECGLSEGCGWDERLCYEQGSAYHTVERINPSMPFFWHTPFHSNWFTDVYNYQHYNCLALNHFNTFKISEQRGCQLESADDSFNYPNRSQFHNNVLSKPNLGQPIAHGPLLCQLASQIFSCRRTKLVSSSNHHSHKSYDNTYVAQIGKTYKD